MNAGVTDAMNHITDRADLSAAAPSVVIAALILCFVAREVLRVADARYRTLARDLVVMIVPLFVAGAVILTLRVLALILDL